MQSCQVLLYHGLYTVSNHPFSLEEVSHAGYSASKAHTGVYLAARVAELLMKYGIQDKLMALVCDNASNNDTMITELERLLPNFGGAKFRVRCFAHVLNLVVKVS